MIALGIKHPARRTDAITRRCSLAATEPFWNGNASAVGITPVHVCQLARHSMSGMWNDNLMGLDDSWAY